MHFETLRKANDLLLSHLEQITAHEQALISAIDTMKETGQDELIVNGKNITLQDLASSFYYLHKKQDIPTYSNARLRQWYDHEIKKGLKISIMILQGLRIPLDELPAEISNWLET